MTFSEAIPIAKELAENELKKHFDTDAFLILAEIARLDAVPDSDIDEHIDTSKDMFAEYMRSRSSARPCRIHGAGASDNI